MKVNLEREDLINLVKGTQPNYNVMNNEIVKRCGSFSGSYGKWDWNYSFDENITDNELLGLYILCRDSFK